jgi:hypothetical protein
MSPDELLPIPSIDTATEPSHSPEDLRQRWRALMGELGFGQRLLWIGFVGPDRRMFKAISQVPLGTSANTDLAESVMTGLEDVLTEFRENVTVALLLTRPGRGPVSHLDRQWSTLLTRLARDFQIPLEPIFRANDEALVLVEPELEATG